METKTAAYNANEVAAIYMSLNRDDLLTQAEGGNKLGNDDSLKNGFYGLSDPMNLRGVLESFECDFSEGGNKSLYKIRILNPTPQLETALFNFYSEVFPSNSSTFKNYKTASEDEERMNSATRGNLYDFKGRLANASTPPLPSLYLRWGYGADIESGLSRIHKVQVGDIKYMVNDKEDKVIELYAHDLFYHLTSNPSFNKRPYVVRTEASDDVDGEISLRKPSEILTELLTDYLTTYPECVPAVDISSYTEPFDNVVFSLAKAMAEGDAISAKNKRIREMGLTPTESTTTEAKELTGAEVAAFYDLLDRPLITATDIDRSAIGDVTPQVLFQAFKIVFEQIGLKWEMRSPHEPEPVTGSIAPQQTTGLNTDPKTDANNQADEVNNIYTTKINIAREWLFPKLEEHYTLISIDNQPNQNRLSYWPMALDEGELRTLTSEEKAANRDWRIWLNAGMVNPDNYQNYINKGEDPGLKFSFTQFDLLEKFEQDDVLGESTIKPLVPVCMPPSLNSERSTNILTLAFTGPISNATAVPLQLCAPVIDLSTGSFLPFDDFSGENVTVPDGDIRVWMGAAAALNNLQDTYDEAELKSNVGNPPLILLEPTVETISFIEVNLEKYEEMVAAKKGEFSDLIAGTIADAREYVASLPADPEVTFRRYINRFSNAYVSMGDDGENPHTTSFLQSILNNINRLIVGRSSKMRIEQVQINGLSTEEKADLKNSCTLLAGVTWEETWAKNDHALLLCMPGDDMSTQFSDVVLKPVKSFPQTYSVDVGNKYLWLDYGTPHSIVADVDFTGDNRFIINLAQSMFSVRQWNDINQLFDGTKTISNALVSNAISRLLSNEIAKLKTKTSTESGAAQVQEREELYRQLQLANNQTNLEINMELLEILPGLLKSYQMDSKKGEGDMSETEVISPHEENQLRMLASLISDSKTLEMLFPTSNVDGETNTIKTEVLMVMGGKQRTVTKQNRILRRRVDLDNVYSRISQDAQAKKMADVDYNYSVAMQQETFKISITTLGIPEIDDPASEYLSRRVCFKFFDPRLGGKEHWLSGVYGISGFRHLINPSQGFLTQLDLYRLPNESLSNIRDTR